MSTCVRMSLLRAPMAFRTPISRVRSITDTSMMFMITMPPTTRAIDTNIGRTVNSMREMLSQNAIASSAVSSAKSASSLGRRPRRARMMPSISICASLSRSGSSVWMMMLSTTPRGDVIDWIGERAGA